MPTWGEILLELQASAAQNNGQPDFDGVRRRYLKLLHDLTGRDTILYSTDYLGKGGQSTSIVLEDMEGMMEVNKGLRGPQLDVILHSPGGDPEATASIVRYLRKKFTHIRVFVPVAAMSAATMWALACDEIVMGKHSQLGPIDPQIVSSQGMIPARAIIDQFERAKEECKRDPSNLAAWMPILQQYGPGLLDQCERAGAMAKRLVRDWLRTYMFAGEDDAEQRASDVAEHFADYGRHQSHNLGIDRDEVRAQGINVADLEQDQDLQDAVLSVHHATIHTFGGPAAKIVENHFGKAWVKLAGQINFQVPAQPPIVIPAGAAPLGPPPPGVAPHYL